MSMLLGVVGGKGAVLLILATYCFDRPNATPCTLLDDDTS